MRPSFLTLGQQLRSSALRYCSPLAGVGAQSRRHPARQLGAATGNAESASDSRIQRLEAVLFLAREPLSSRKLSQFANLEDATEARTLVRRLNDSYDDDGRAFRVESVAGGYQLLTRPRFSSWLRRLKNVPSEVRLSGPALETLAVIAYRQPTDRATVEAIRGVACGEILRQLMDRDLVRISGRSEELGRPYLYATTKRFLQLFGLKSLDKLPRVAELRTALQDQEKAVLAGINEEETNVVVTTVAEWSSEEQTEELIAQPNTDAPKNAVEDDDFFDDDDELDDDDDDELDDDDDDVDELDDDDDDELDDDDEDDDWEEVDADDDDDDDDDEDDDDDDWEEVDDDGDDDEDDEEWDDEDDEDMGWSDDEDDSEETP